MARQGKEPKIPDLPEIDPQTAIRLLDSQVQKGRALLESRPLSDDAHSQWKLLTRNYLEKAFGRSSPNVRSITDVGRYGSFPMGAGEAWWENHRAKGLTTQLTRLEGLIELLRTESQLRGGDLASSAEPGRPVGDRVFLVHGHDERALHDVARFLEHLALDPVILREQPNQGRTIIEKFEDYSDVGFAVVLLTPDDRGGPTGDPFESQRARARQNVILELGYFLGRLGRARVCALYVQDVEIPSDYAGVLYVHLDDDGSWRLTLAKELRAAGFAVDMNRAL